MRLMRFTMTTHVVSAGLGAGFTCLGLLWGNGWGISLAVLVAALAAAAMGGYTGIHLGRRLGLVEQALASGRLERCAGTGVWEIDRLAELLREYAQRWTDSTAHARQQAREVETLLAQMNGRSTRGLASRDDASLAHHLRQSLANLAKAAEGDLEQVLSSAGQIEDRTQQMVAGVEEQTTAVGQATTSVEQMSADIDSVSDNAEAANRAAAAARESAAAGLELVRELIRGMDRIRLHVEASGRKLRTLGDHSQEVGSIVETIGAISARTDLLALNASIESVRAGDHGRGFAVVAEEVRKLAEQTAQAAREVTSLIESIQTETQESIVVMAEERAQVETEVQRVHQAGLALERIGQTSGDSAQRVGEISRATLHQLRVTQEVVLAMQRISEVARGIRSQAEGVRGTSLTLTELARQLDNSLSPLRHCTEAAGEQRLTRSPHEPDSHAHTGPMASAANPAVIAGRRRHHAVEAAEPLVLVGSEELHAL